MLDTLVLGLCAVPFDKAHLRRAFFNNVLLGSDGHALNGGCSR